MTDVVEKMRLLERQNYLKAHQNDYPFPLDGSDWARLINEKLYREKHPHCACESCNDFLSKLQGGASLLRRQRAVVSKAMHHWFLLANTAINQVKTMRDQLTAAELAKAKVTEDSLKKPTNLAEAEKSWISTRSFVRHEPLGLLEGEESDSIEDLEATRKLAIPEEYSPDLGADSLTGLIEELRDDLRERAKQNIPIEEFKTADNEMLLIEMKHDGNVPPLEDGLCWDI